MTRKATNRLLQQAKRSKKDEFYTQYCDIERVLEHYGGQFTGKVVYCNCDDPRDSNFFRYFAINFERLGLKKLMASCYTDGRRSSHTSEATEKGIYGEWNGGSFDKESITITELNGDGDFRSHECLALLESADVVVTNPPFSLFREFVTTITAREKEFLIIGNVNAITYKEIFSLIQHDKAWLGVNLGRGISGFIVPEHYETYGTETSVNAEGQTIIATNNCLWLTNLDTSQRHKPLTLTKSYRGNEDSYPTYDNCDGINVNRTQDIPCDYWGVMGVPITFLHKYNPDQFEIVRFRKGDDGKDLCVNGSCPYFRILIRRKGNDMPNT